ncbi:flagellar filament capping protein FliD [Alkalibaculum sp. M08DMB]|uniref:Flagellar hook-associated protein 2 n=1 Tax=Alkalibaculum sporogenes TaxID=2655001 RepID=A0A6A7K5Y1_9FIRM|nr:flagellar filament capping protein FliD [Alkalibaculum sporogenes]MPW24785.1 flagellar filament capping protein FliD [Alkalibaculum sporogenes]
MAGISFIGSYSGIDKGTIDKLMEAERMPLVNLTNKKTGITAKQNAWKDINTRLNTLFEKLKVLQNSDTFTAKKATSSNENIVSMTTSKDAVPGIYNIHVEQLASSASVISGEISLAEGNINKELGIEGAFTIGNADGISFDIAIEEGDTLKTIAAKVNDASNDTGISATIINSRLVLTDSTTGKRDITLTDGVGGNGTLAQLGLSDTASVKEGTNALFTVNGVEVERNTNTVDDAIEHVTINLSNVHSAGQYETVNVELDTEKLTKAVQEFVDQYNSTMTFIEGKLAAGDPEVPGSAGALSGDSSLMRLHSSLRSLVTSTLNNENSSISDISQIGVSTVDRYGKLEFDATKLTEALSKDPQNVMDFFTSNNVDGKDIGFASRLNSYVDSFVSNSNGIIKIKTEGLDRTLKDLAKQIETFNARMVKKEAYYIKMFSALDVAMMKAESQMDWLAGQINAMNTKAK